jgi:hypothetical protein
MKGINVILGKANSLVDIMIFREKRKSMLVYVVIAGVLLTIVAIKYCCYA